MALGVRSRGCGDLVYRGGHWLHRDLLGVRLNEYGEGLGCS
jgi:hypothetical protein